MTEYVKWMPYTHGDQPPYWIKDMLASVDEDGEKVNADWAWLAWSTYYVPYEAVHGVPFKADADLITTETFGDYKRGFIEGLETAAQCVEDLLGKGNRASGAIRLLACAALQETER